MERRNMAKAAAPLRRDWKRIVSEHAWMILLSPMWVPLMLVDRLRLRCKTGPLVCGRIDEAWDRCATIWRQRGFVCQWTAHAGASFEHDLAAALALRHPGEAAFFANKLTDPDPLLAAYAFKCLIRLAKPRREDLPVGLLQRSEKIQVQRADLIAAEPLGSYLDAWFREQGQLDRDES